MRERRNEGRILIMVIPNSRRLAGSQLGRYAHQARRSISGYKDSSVPRCARILGMTVFFSICDESVPMRERGNEGNSSRFNLQ
jgi:hypothetical protein